MALSSAPAKPASASPTTRSKAVPRLSLASKQTQFDTKPSTLKKDLAKLDDSFVVDPDLDFNFDLDPLKSLGDINMPSLDSLEADLAKLEAGLENLGFDEFAFDMDDDFDMGNSSRSAFSEDLDLDDALRGIESGQYDMSAFLPELSALDSER